MAHRRYGLVGGCRLREDVRLPVGAGEAHTSGSALALQLYGLHRRAPYANLAGMGAAFVVARCGHHVVDVTADAIHVRSPAGSGLRIDRREPEGQTVLAWSLVSVR